MKRIGILGGMSPQSTGEYYKLINEQVQKELGGSHSADMVIASVDFEKIVKMQHADNWNALTNELVLETDLKLSSADFILLATNTMHKCLPDLKAKTNKEFLSIVDVTAEAISAQGISQVALLGTSFTMEDGFYQKGLKEYGIDVLLPPANFRKFIHEAIYDELCKGVIRDCTRETFLSVIERLEKQGAKGVILGCTEIPLLIRDAVVPVFDTTKIHCEAAVKYALQ